MPIISVIVPVYKVESYIYRCVDSILAQTFRDFELILVDDGSPDNCGVICDEYAAKDSRIHVIHQENGGLSAARNTGIDWAFANSDSQWLTFVDSDDWIHPEMLQRLLDAAIQYKIQISVGGFESTENDDPVITKESVKPEIWRSETFFLDKHVNAVVAWGKLYAKEIFREIRYPVGKIHEDEYVTYKLLFACEKIVFIPAPFYAYFVNHDGIMKSSWNIRKLDVWDAFDEQMRIFEESGNWKLYDFRVRDYLDHALYQMKMLEASTDTKGFVEDKRFIKNRIRFLIKKARERDMIDFWCDYEMLCKYYPVSTQIYRIYAGVKRRLGIDDES